MRRLRMNESWRRNLYAVFIAQFLVILGFSFVGPFMPLFIQHLGDYTDGEAALWAGVATGSSGLLMFFSAPLWGMAADRWGRKPMVLRAMFGSAILTGLTGLAPNVFTVILLRAGMGLISGNMAAASALVSSLTPVKKLPFAMGFLMMAMFGGTSLGPLFGGFLADSVGYQNTFYISGLSLFLGGLIVLFVVREKFVRPPAQERSSLTDVFKLATSRQMLPLLAALCVVQAGPQMISPIIPLFIRELDPTGMSASLAGLAFCLMGITASLTSVLAGRMGERWNLRKLLFISCLVTSLLYLPPLLATGAAQLIIFIAIIGFSKGGLMASSSTLVGLTASRGQQGVAYGVAQSANAIGNGMGPLIGGSLAPLLGLRAVFGVGSLLFLLVSIPVGTILMRQKEKQALKTE